MNEMIMVSHSLNNNTRTGLCYIFLFKYKSFDQSDPPNSLKFRHLPSCGTITKSLKSFKNFVDNMTIMCVCVCVCVRARACACV